MEAKIDVKDQNLPVIFITGNSRSGTTVMMRIMDNHSQIHAINEPHFFEKMWSKSDESKFIDSAKAELLLARLFSGQREGFFEKAEKHRHKFHVEIQALIGDLGKDYTRLDIFSRFLHYETGKNGKRLPCEKTPQNVFYIQEILENFPNARIINMVRDPRGVMLSQKRKWKRRQLGANFITRREVVRLRINYHPITISKLWNAALDAAKAFSSEKRVLDLKFEDLVKSPEETVKRLCKFLNLPFESGMLLVPHAGSSSVADQQNELGIRIAKPQSWIEKGLTRTEISVCQDICAEYMLRYGYQPIQVKSNVLELAGQYAFFPFKLGLALLINLNRMRNLADSLKRRLLRR